MPDDLENRRLYGDKEISRILKRAAELQQIKGRADSGGISINEIEQIAAELGIDPRYVRDAAVEYSGDDDAGEGRSIFGRTVIEIRRTVKGEVSERQWERMVQEIRRALGIPGEIGRLGQSMEWKSPDKELISYQATVSPQEGKIDIQITCWRDGLSFLTFFVFAVFGALAALLMAKALVFSLIAWPAAAAILVVAVASARTLLDRLALKEEQRLKRLADRLEAVVAETAPAQIEEAASKAETHQAMIEDRAEEKIEERRDRIRERA